jgi:preprotein translocase subunit SecF
MFIIKNKNIFLTISALIVLLSIVSIAVFGLKLGIDFKGGALEEVTYTASRPDVATVSDALAAAGFKDALVQPTGTDGFLVKVRALSEAEHQTVLKALSVGEAKATEKSFNSIGPSVGNELKRKAIAAILTVVVAIILFIAYAFRKVSKPVSSWKYGLIAIVTLVHDIVIPSGVFALLGHFRGAEVDTLFVVALLTVLGLSVSDTIVVFDRIRENLRAHSGNTFGETVGKSLSQTFTRSINTSLTVILVLLSLFFFGPEATKNFSLVLVVGMFFGTYSSIFVASPILVLVERLQAKKALARKHK